MHPSKSLAIWAESSMESGIDWYLYGETLLCAKGYGSFPDTLTYPQILVFSRDLRKITEQVIPKLPDTWTLHFRDFAEKAKPIQFRQGDAVVLELHVLHPQTDSRVVHRIREKLRSRRIFLKLLNEVIGFCCGGWIEKRRTQNAEHAFRELVSVLQKETDTAELFTDCLTSKKEKIFSREALEWKQTIQCDDGEYPVFAGFEAYLSETYVDYETGLFDAIGCGLDAREKEELRLHQKHCREALDFVRQVGEEFGLRYYLLAGSVLGCVRHQGFVPWDDDIDIGIRVEDIAEFEDVVARELPKRLPKEFHLKQCGPRNGYPRMFSKICYEGRCCIDLWPLVPTYMDGLGAKWVWYFAKIITKVHYRKLNHKVNRFVKLVNFMGMFMTDGMVLWFARTNERLFLHCKPTAYINLYSIYQRRKETIPVQWLDTEATGTFEGLTVPVVGCTDDYLTHLYGNYMSFPPPWKRASRHVGRFL